MTAMRGIALLFFGLWLGYWLIAERQAHREKPISEIAPDPWSINTLLRLLIILFGLILFLQLTGLRLFPISLSGQLSFAGLIILMLGVAVAFSARHTLANNWTAGYEYQIKKGQELVTSGIYHYIRHPIYLGFLLFAVGAELVAGSYLVIIYLVAAVLGFTYQAKREEKLLISHFGERYKKYMKKTKMFIPFIW